MNFRGTTIVVEDNRLSVCEARRRKGGQPDLISQEGRFSPPE